MSLSEDIKDFATELGYSKVGITTADAFPDYIVELEARYEMYDWFIEGGFNTKPLSEAEPRSVMPSARSIIVMLSHGFKTSFPEELVDKIGRHYLPGSPHSARGRNRRRLMREFLEKRGCQVAHRLAVPSRLAAARAGVVVFGRNCFGFAEDIGSFVNINTFIVDTELKYDEPTIKVECPPKCTACIKACPTGALYDPLRIDPRRCITFLTSLTQDGRFKGVTSYIPPEMRNKMGTRIQGCDVCQEVCPKNHRILKAELPWNEFRAKIAADFELTKLLNLSDEHYTNKVMPVLGQYRAGKKHFQRNAAIALGNMGDPTFIPDLAQAMQDPEELVRSYAAWALGKIGGNHARQILEVSLAQEIDESVKMEIKAALAAA